MPWTPAPKADLRLASPGSQASVAFGLTSEFLSFLNGRREEGKKPWVPTRVRVGLYLDWGGHGSHGQGGLVTSCGLGVAWGERWKLLLETSAIAVLPGHLLYVQPRTSEIEPSFSPGSRKCGGQR